jgi:hypothetical protein
MFVRINIPRRLNAMKASPEGDTPWEREVFRETNRLIPFLGTVTENEDGSAVEEGLWLPTTA